MRNCIGIRHENKDLTERRAPLTPDQVGQLIRDHQVEVLVEPSPTRIFPEEAYRAVGAIITPDLSRSNIIFGVKEIPLPSLAPEQTYCYFSHTIKAQPHNMPMLKRLLELKDTLLDYELVKDDTGHRVIFFGNFAGYAGMIDTLWALGRRLEWEGLTTPFADIRPAHRYADLDEARAAVREVGERIRREGLPEALAPLVVGFTGYGQVSRGAQHIFDLLPVETLSPEELPAFFAEGKPSRHRVYKVEFHKPHMYRHKAGQPFKVEEFTHHPERYEGNFHTYVPYLTVIVNGIYWEPEYPRLLTRRFVREWYRRDPHPRLRVIGDITCDVDGSIELTVKATNSENPVYVVDPFTDEVRDGWEGPGPVIMAVDKLPTELPREASEAFGAALLPFVPALAAADFTLPYRELIPQLPPEFRHAVIAHRGELTPEFAYLKEHVNAGE